MSFGGSQAFNFDPYLNNPWLGTGQARQEQDPYASFWDALANFVAGGAGGATQAQEEAAPEWWIKWGGTGFGGGLDLASALGGYNQETGLPFVRIGGQEYALPGGIANAQPSVAYNPFTEELSVLVRGADNALYQAAGRVRGGQLVWSDWTPLGGELTSAPQAVFSYGNVLSVGRGVDDAVYVNVLDPQGKSQWVSLGGQIQGQPAAVSDNGGNAYVVARGADNALYLNLIGPGGQRTGWGSLGGVATSDPTVWLDWDPATNTNLIGIGVIGQDGLPWVKWVDSQGWETTWTQQSYEGAPTAQVPTPPPEGPPPAGGPTPTPLPAHNIPPPPINFQAEGIDYSNTEWPGGVYGHPAGPLSQTVGSTATGRQWQWTPETGWVQVS